MLNPSDVPPSEGTIRVAVEVRTPAAPGGTQVVFRGELEVQGHPDAFQRGAEFQTACAAIAEGIVYAAATSAHRMPDPSNVVGETLAALPEAEPTGARPRPPIPSGGTVGLDQIPGFADGA